MKLAKKYAESIKSYDRSKSYEVGEAVKIVLDTAKAKFDETVELHVRLGVDPRQADSSPVKEKSGVNAKIVTALVLSALAVAAIVILYFTGRRKFVRMDK